MIICSCNVLTDREVRTTVATAVRLPTTTGQVYKCLGCRPKCGRCEAARRFTTFAPLSLAAIGSLPLPILHRGIIIRMERAPRTAQLERFDPKTSPEQQRMCGAVHDATLEWARETQFDADPPMPEGLHNRAADNWRVCFAIADAAGGEWAKAARDAAIELSRGQDEDMGVQLLLDVRGILDRLALDRIGSGRLVGELVDLPDGRWSEWRGVKGDNAPRALFTRRAGSDAGAVWNQAGDNMAAAPRD
jgi:bacterioferritin-associated ferredoxin